MEWLQAAVRRHPENIALHIALADALHALGKAGEAELACREALNRFPENIDLRVIRGLALGRLGRGREGLTEFAVALKLAPDNARILSGMGVLLFQMDKTAEAVGAFKRAVTIDPGYAEAWSNLGAGLRARGRHDEAIACYRKSLALAPNQASVYNNLGNVERDRVRFETAEQYYRKAIELAPAFADAHVNLGWALLQIGRVEEAVASIRQALSLRPDFAEAHREYATALKQLGSRAEAMDHCRRAIELHPGYAEVYLLLAGMKRFAEVDADVQAMQALFESPSSSDEQRVYLGFALGKAFEDMRQHDRAFGYYQAANRLKRATFEFRLEDTRRDFDRIKTVFVREWMRGVPPVLPEAGHLPIFIVGMPRSGTSLVEQILSSHPEVYGAGELFDIQQIAVSLGGGGYPENVARLGDGELAAGRAEYFRRLRRLATQARYISDKMPQNFLYLGLIRLMLPEARIVHCRRSPMDTCLSIYKNHFGGHHGYAYDLAELGGYYRLYEDLMAHWRQVLPEDWLHEVVYEDLIADQETHTRSLLDYCGLKWDPACLAFHKTKRPVATASASQVRRPLYGDSVGLAERYGAALNPLRQALGQPLDA